MNNVEEKRSVLEDSEIREAFGLIGDVVGSIGRFMRGLNRGELNSLELSESYYYAWEGFLLGEDFKIVEARSDSEAGAFLDSLSDTVLNTEWLCELADRVFSEIGLCDDGVVQLLFEAYVYDLVFSLDLEKLGCGYSISNAEYYDVSAFFRESWMSDHYAFLSTIGFKVDLYKAVLLQQIELECYSGDMKNFLTMFYVQADFYAQLNVILEKRMDAIQAARAELCQSLEDVCFNDD